jgi:hypothetical protein
MATQAEIIEQLTEVIEMRVSQWGERMPELQRQSYDVVLNLTADLDTDADGKIKPTTKNIKIISKIKDELNRVIFDKRYQDDLDLLLEDYNEITKLQNQYFTFSVGRFKVPSVMEQISNLARESVIDQLGQDAIGVNFVDPVRDILVKNVTTGGSRAEFIEQVREYILDTDAGEGKLAKYTKQIVTDSLNQYSANYSAVLTDDLGLEWYQYSGSLKDTSRPICDALIEAKKGCMPFIHRSQFQEIVDGYVCGERVPIYDKTGLPQGMIPGTNAANFRINRGGYTCNHQLYPVSAAIVPKKLRDKFAGK